MPEADLQQLNTQSAKSATTKLTVVVSQGQSRNPQKRLIETELADAASKIAGVQVLMVPHVYDLVPGGDSYAQLAQVQSPIVFISWLYGRAAFWVLDRNGIYGQFGAVELVPSGEDLDEDDDVEDSETNEDSVLTQLDRPSRLIYCLDFRASESPQDFAAEISRILEEVENASPGVSPETAARFENPTNTTALAIDGSGRLAFNDEVTATAISEPQKIEEHPGRRWYPVIDFSRCTNCMECIDFCLFGVYGVDGAETILVEQPDNCRKGCPACSRVCPHNAIIFPQHKTPAIAGAAVDTGGLKIDLSKLFGAPESNEDAAETAARERDEQLILAGRQAVGASESAKAGSSTDLPGTVNASESSASKPKDEFDNLLDELDDLDI